MKQISQKNNFVYLFFSLIVLLFSAAIGGELPGNFGEDLISLVTLFMLLASIKSIKTDVTWTKTMYVVIGFFVLLTLLEKFFPQERALYLIFLSLFVTATLYLTRAYKGDNTVFMLTAVTMMMVFKNGEINDVFL